MDSDPFRFTIEGTIAAVGAVLAAVFSIMSWFRQVCGERLHVALDSPSAGEGETPVRVILTNGASRPVRVDHVVIDGGVFSEPMAYNNQTGLNDIPVESSSTTRNVRIILAPGESRFYDERLLPSHPGGIMSVKVKPISRLMGSFVFQVIIKIRR